MSKRCKLCKREGGKPADLQGKAIIKASRSAKSFDRKVSESEKPTDQHTRSNKNISKNKEIPTMQGDSSRMIGIFLSAWAKAGNFSKERVRSMIYNLSFCSIALIFQLFEIKHRVNIMDWPSLMDTIGAISIVSIILVAIAVLLNLMANSICKADN